MIRIFAAFLIFSVSALYAQDAAELNRKGAELGEQKKYSEAIDYFMKSAEIYDAQSAKFYHNKAWLFETQGANDKAFDLYEKALQKNPNQPETLERLGYHYYRRADYRKAIELGERAAALNPSVENLKSWLPDAYRKNLEAASAERVKADEEKKLKEAGPSIGDEVTKSEERKKKAERPKVAGFSLDVALRYGRGVKGGRPFYISSPGKLMNFPLAFNIWFKPTPNLYVHSLVESPYWGAAVVPIVGQQEFLETVFSFGRFGLGAGLWFTHYTDDIVFGEDKSLNDMKAGFIFKYEDDKSYTSITAYPRLLPRDTKTFSSGKTLDCSLYELTYRYYISKKMGYYSRISQYDFYLFDHKAAISNYWGFFEIALGLSLDYDAIGSVRGGSFFIEYAKRMNLRKLDCDKPYNHVNGQNFMGIDFGRDPKLFSGYRSKSNILRIGATQMLTPSVYIYQKAVLEIVDRHEKNQEFLMRLGAGVNL